MTLLTTIFIVLFLVIIYYVGMISYDLYAAKMAKLKEEENREVPIDVSGQLDDFESQDIDNQSEDDMRRKTVVTWICKGLSAQQMNRLMEDAVSGTANADLKNILTLCDNAIAKQ